MISVFVYKIIPNVVAILRNPFNFYGAVSYFKRCVLRGHNIVVFGLKLLILGYYCKMFITIIIRNKDKRKYFIKKAGGSSFSLIH